MLVSLVDKLKNLRQIFERLHARLSTRNVDSIKQHRGGRKKTEVCICDLSAHTHHCSEVWSYRADSCARCHQTLLHLQDAVIVETISHKESDLPRFDRSLLKVGIRNHAKRW